MEQIEGYSPNQVWFTADTHFGQPNVIPLSRRPFADVAEMDAELIRRWQETVPRDGVVFHLGDFGQRKPEAWNRILGQLPGRKILILGNHDMRCLHPAYLWQFHRVALQMNIRVGAQAILLNHYPFLCYGGAYRDVWQLFGHVHSGPQAQRGMDLPRLPMLFPLQYDVGVDNNDYRPVSYAQVKAKIEAQVAAAQATPSPGTASVPP